MNQFLSTAKHLLTFKSVAILVLAVIAVTVAVIAVVVALLPHPPPPSPSPSPSPSPIDFNGKKASTTMFKFGPATACVCNGEKVSSELIKQKWFGCATPDWLLTPFLGRQGQIASSDTTPQTLKGTKYYSNCGVGEGGCGSCWQLTTTGEKNIYNKTTKKGIKMNVVVVDACEDRNAYGNNTQWCMAAKNVPRLGIDTKGLGPDATRQLCKSKNVEYFGNHLLPGVFNLSSPDDVQWSQKECVSGDGTWTCTNLAGQPVHFDIAMADLSKKDIAAAGGWEQGSNPIVTIKKVKCPSKVTNILRQNCGANAAPGSNDHCFWCPKDPKANQGAPGSMPSRIPSWWGGCGPDKQKPQCAPMNTQCGGKGYTGPTCCQWPDNYKCNTKNKYYSGCEKL